MYDYKLKTVKNFCNRFFSCLVVSKIGCEKVQLKIKTVKSIRNRYLYF